MKKFLVICSVAILAMMVSISPAFADSNREEVRHNLSADGWHIIYGDSINEGDYIKFFGAVAAAVLCECTQPLEAYMNYQIEVQIQKISQSAPDIIQSSISSLIIDSFDGGGVLTISNLEIDAGLATYNNWETVIYDEPRTEECWAEGGPSWARYKYSYPCIKMVEVERQIPLLNTFQPYIRYRFVQS